MPNPPLSEEERKRRKQALNRKRTIADLRSKLKVEKKKVRAAGSMLKVPSTPEMYRELREHGLHVDDDCEVCSFLFL